MSLFKQISPKKIQTGLKADLISDSFSPISLLDQLRSQDYSCMGKSLGNEVTHFRAKNAVAQSASTPSSHLALSFRKKYRPVNKQKGREF